MHNIIEQHNKRVSKNRKENPLLDYVDEELIPNPLFNFDLAMGNLSKYYKTPRPIQKDPAKTFIGGLAIGICIGIIAGLVLGAYIIELTLLK